MDRSLIEALRSSWELLSARAWWALNHSAGLPPSVSGGQPFHGIPRLRLWADVVGTCRYHPAVTLTVYELLGANLSRHPVVREAVWQRDSDLRRVQRDVDRTREIIIFEPTISVRDATVPDSELAALLGEATSFHVPMAWFEGSQGVTNGVGTRGFEFFSREQPPAVLRLEWSFEPPTIWHPILNWANRLEEFLTGCFPPADNTTVRG